MINIIQKNDNTMKSNFSQAWNEMYTKIVSWGDTFVINIPNIVIAIIVFITALIVARYANKLIQRIFIKTSIQQSMRKVLGRVAAFLIVGAALFLILGILDLNKTLNTILAGAGVMGLAVGLALQGALANTYSGIILSYIKNIKNGDWIKSNGYEGEIIDINFRAITLKQKDNNLVFIPNKMVIENPVKNYSSTSRSRVILENSVAYNSGLEHVKQLTTKIIIDNFEVPQTEEDVLFLYREFADNSITYEIRFWIDSFSSLQVAKAKSKAMMLIKSAYDKEGIEIPFPVRTIDLGNQLDRFFSKNKKI